MSNIAIKSLSTYGWISSVIVSLIVAVFNGVGTMKEWYRGVVNYNSGADDDQGGLNDMCYSSAGFFPGKQWYISLANGICFPTTVDGAPLTPALTTSPDGVSCLAWEASLNGVKIFDNTDGITTYCNYYSNANIYGTTVSCDNYGTKASNYMSGGGAGKAGIAFAVFALLLSLVGTFFACSKNNGNTTKMVQAATGAFFFLSVLMNFIMFGSDSGVNPFLDPTNNVLLGCLPGFVSNNYFSVFLAARGYYVTIASVIMSITMGGLCLTTSVCDNRCCCPCCFTIADVEANTTVTATATATATSGVSKTGNGGVVGVQV